MIYFILFPCLLVQTLTSADLEGVDILPMGAALLSALLIMTGCLSALRHRLHLNGPAYSSLFQGAVRWNGFIGIATASNLFGSAGKTLMAIAISFLVPAANVLSIYVLNRHAGNGDTSLGAAIMAVARNPLILACVTGIVLNAGVSACRPFWTPLWKYSGMRHCRLACWPWEPHSICPMRGSFPGASPLAQA